MKRCNRARHFLALLVGCLVTNASRGDSFNLDALDLEHVEQGWGQPHANQSVEGHGLSIGGKKFENGLGTHAVSTLRVALAGKGERFTGQVGVDDEVGQRGSVVFKIIGDGKTLWESGVIHGGDGAQEATVSLQGVK